MISNIPQKSYGMLNTDHFNSPLDEVADQVSRLGYAIFESGYSSLEIERMSQAFDRIQGLYLRDWGIERLRALNEHNTIRALLTLGEPVFIELATNSKLIEIVGKLIKGKFILNQQNGIINPPGQHYNQGLWHRDLPYQHFTSSTPLAINALFCLDAFTLENGATFVLPASHKVGSFPAEQYIQNNAIQISAKPGDFILLDCMLFHSGGFNRSSSSRRGINHVYNIPYFRQQIQLAGNIDSANLSKEAIEVLGISNAEPRTIEEFFNSRRPISRSREYP